MTKFKAPENTTQQMADLLPDGRAWGSKNIEGRNVRKLLESLAVAHNRIQQQIEVLSEEYDINQSVDLLTDWEESVGLPDKCLTASQTLAERRAAVIERLSKKATVTLQQFQDLVDSLFPGAGIIIYPGYEYFNFEYTFQMTFLGNVNDKFLLVVEVPVSGQQFEYDWELEFSGGVDTVQLECILSEIIPSNVVIIITSRG